MTNADLAARCGFSPINPCGEDREIHSVYCCDLLSFAMGRAPADGAWFTVMGNLNTVAVASLTDVACVVLADGASMDEAGLAKAKQQGIPLYATSLPVFEAALAVHRLLGE